MTWGLPGTWSASVMVSERRPEAVGTKVTEMVQVPKGGTEAVQPLVLVKSPGLVPPGVTEEMSRGALPELVTVTTMGELVAPREVAGKLTGLGESKTAGMPFGRGVTWPQPAARKRRERTQKERASFSKSRILDT